MADVIKPIVGIDPGLNSTGIVVGSSPNEWTHRRVSTPPLLHSRLIGDNVSARMKRIKSTVKGVVDFLKATCPNGIKAIAIEDYRKSAKTYKKQVRGKWVTKTAPADTRHIEYAGIVRLYIVPLAEHVVEVSPSTLKKFATGSGRAKKDDIMLSVFQRWGAQFTISDEADAFALWRLGLGCFGGVKADIKEAGKLVEAYDDSVRVVMDRYTKGKPSDV